MASSLPSLQVRKGSAVNEFLGFRLIEKMAEVGTRSSMTSNHEIVKVGSSTWPLNHCCSVYSCYRVGPAITFHAVYTNEMHAQARSGRAKRATLLVHYIHVCKCLQYMCSNSIYKLCCIEQSCNST